jgi:hypothetical protein
MDAVIVSALTGGVLLFVWLVAKHAGSAEQQHRDEHRDRTL